MSGFKTHVERLEAFKQVDIYPVISSEFCAGRPVIKVLEQIALAGAKVVQIREKNAGKRDLYELVMKCREITDFYKMLLIVDDQVDVAIAAGADGVHLGQDDLPLKAARSLDKNLLLGTSTHNPEEIQEAIEQGCSYLNIGPIFPTQTKNLSYHDLGLEAVRNWGGDLPVPFSVMGGIKERHLPELLSAGARHIAMVTEITQADNIAERVRQLRGYWGK